MVSEHNLSVWLEADQVGELALDPATDALALQYTPHWQTSGFGLSPYLPLNPLIFARSATPN